MNWYVTDRDLAKWQYFPERLIVLGKNDIKDIRNNTFSIDKLTKKEYQMSVAEVALQYLKDAEKKILEECPPPYDYPSVDGKAAFIVNHAISALTVLLNTPKEN